MQRTAGRDGGDTGMVGGARSNGNVSGTDGQQPPDVSFTASPIIEISDKDYRSFCWPCLALEEVGDDKPGE